jgi:hypothetical protein
MICESGEVCGTLISAHGFLKKGDIEDEASPGCSGVVL